MPFPLPMKPECMLTMRTFLIVRSPRCTFVDLGSCPSARGVEPGVKAMEV